LSLEIVDPSSTELEHLASVDVKFSGAHIGAGIYFSANHNPGPGGTNSAIPQRGLDGEVEQHDTTEIDYTLPPGAAPWDDYRDDIDGNGSLDFVKAGFDMALHVGDRLSSTGEFYDGPSVPLLIAMAPKMVQGAHAAFLKELVERAGGAFVKPDLEDQRRRRANVKHAALTEMSAPT
jgi:hypothetical protein